MPLACCFCVRIDWFACAAAIDSWSMTATAPHLREGLLSPRSSGAIG
jgi:hypothetical protein